jgi:hypothetical protein
MFGILSQWPDRRQIIGYSWQDTHNPSAVNPGYGISVGWKRFVLVTVGVFASL